MAEGNPIHTPILRVHEIDGFRCSVTDAEVAVSSEVSPGCLYSPPGKEMSLVRRLRTLPKPDASVKNFDHTGYIILANGERVPLITRIRDNWVSLKGPEDRPFIGFQHTDTPLILHVLNTLRRLHADPDPFKNHYCKRVR